MSIGWFLYFQRLQNRVEKNAFYSESHDTVTCFSVFLHTSHLMIIVFAVESFWWLNCSNLVAFNYTSQSLDWKMTFKMAISHNSKAIYIECKMCILKKHSFFQSYFSRSTKFSVFHIEMQHLLIEQNLSYMVGPKNSILSRYFQPFIFIVIIPGSSKSPELTQMKTLWSGRYQSGNGFSCSLAVAWEYL